MECVKNYGQMFVILYRGQRTKPSKEKEIQEAKWLSEEALKIAEEKKRSEKQGRKEKMHPTKCKVSENSKNRLEGLLQ